MASLAELSITRQEAPPIPNQSSASPASSPAATSNGIVKSTSNSNHDSVDSCIANVFVGEVPGDLRCNAYGCQRVPREPVVTQCCSQVYSRACLDMDKFAREQEEDLADKTKKKDKENGARPLDMVVVRDKTRTMCCLSENELVYTMDEERRKRINLLVVKCNNNGCEWSGTVAALFEDHPNTCEYAQVHCSECAGEVIRHNLARHQREDCRYRSMRCPYCNEEGKYAEIVGLDVALVNKHRCLKLLVSCPNRCKNSCKFERGKLSQHLAVCPLQSVDCDFKSVGCHAQLTRKMLNQHRKNSQEHHLLLLLTAMQTKMTLLHSEIDFLARSVQDPTTATSLACMKSHITMGALCLDGIGDRVTFRIKNYNHLQCYSEEDGKWESPPFYFSSKYRMELIAYPGGLSEFMGRSLSIILRVNKPENQSSGNDIGWPLDCAFIALQISILPQVNHHHNQPLANSDTELIPNMKSVTAHVCHMCRERLEYGTLPENGDQVSAEVLIENNFAPSETLTEAGLLFHDSIILQVELTSCECTYD